MCCERKPVGLPVQDRCWAGQTNLTNQQKGTVADLGESHHCPKYERCQSPSSRAQGGQYSKGAREVEPNPPRNSRARGQAIGSGSGSVRRADPGASQTSQSSSTAGQSLKASSLICSFFPFPSSNYISLFLWVCEKNSEFWSTAGSYNNVPWYYGPSACASQGCRWSWAASGLYGEAPHMDTATEKK